jgi:hypothetical protein
MPALPELQQAVLGALLTGDAGPVAGFVREDGIPAARRLQIYRNNARENFVVTLRATYPVILRLGGAAWFEQTAGRYRAWRPSRCGDLQYVGEQFPAFLGLELADSDYGYFRDVARLEWAYQQVLTAADAPLLDLSRLAAVAADDYARLRFVLHPALRTLASVAPVLAIWRANQPEDTAFGTRVDLDSGPSRVLLTRQRDHVELRECPPGLFVLTRTLADGRPLGAAATLASRVEPGFDLAAALQRLAALGAFTDFRVDPNTVTILEETWTPPP